VKVVGVGREKGPALRTEFLPIRRFKHLLDFMNSELAITTLLALWLEGIAVTVEVLNCSWQRAVTSRTDDFSVFIRSCHTLHTQGQQKYLRMVA
jgi:hypothetical protein